MNIVHTLRQRAELQPGVPALIDRTAHRDRVLSFSALNRLVDYLSLELEQRGIKPGKRVWLGLESSQEFYAHLLALLQIGAVPVIPSRPKETVRQAWPELDIFGCIAVGSAGGDLRKLARSASVRVDPGKIKMQARWLRLGRLGSVATLGPEAPAIILIDAAGRYLLWTAERLNKLLGTLSSILRLKPGEIDFCYLPLFFLANLAAGLTTVVPAASAWNILSVQRKQVERFKANRATGESVRFVHLLSRPHSSLHRICLTDPPIQPRIAAMLADRLAQVNIDLLYGLGAPVAIASLREQEYDNDYVFVGVLLDSIETESREDHELVVRAPHLPLRLHPGGSEEKLGDDSWLPTGVVGRVDEQRRLWVRCDRVSGPAKSR
jgi:AMP-binding enzyme